MLNTTPSPALLTPTNHALVLIDHQPLMTVGTNNITTEQLNNNVTGLAKSAKLFGVPTVLTTIAAETVSGPIFPSIQRVFPDQKPIDRTTMNSWEDENFAVAVAATGQKRLVIAALWSEVCGVFPALSAVHAGYEVYFITDASGGVSDEGHNRAVERMRDSGVQPLTWLQYLLELQRDWARQESYEGVMDILFEHGGKYGVGLAQIKYLTHGKANEGVRVPTMEGASMS